MSDGLSNWVEKREKKDHVTSSVHFAQIGKGSMGFFFQHSRLFPSEDRNVSFQSCLGVTFHQLFYSVLGKKNVLEFAVAKTESKRKLFLNFTVKVF